VVKRCYDSFLLKPEQTFVRLCVEAVRYVEQERNTRLIKLSTDKTVSEIAAALQVAILANHFGVMQDHNLKETI
jgi:hypothetical protein